MPSKQQLSQPKAGFTIIEVVLVLAIAGLIFLMVFVALPALQRSQRDTARRNDMSRVDTSLVQYQTNHNTDTNNLPYTGSTASSIWTATEDFSTKCSGESALACSFVQDYMNSGASETNKANEFQDPDGVPYNMVIAPNWAIDGAPDTAKYNENSKLVIADGSGKETTENVYDADGNITGTQKVMTGGNAYTIGGESPFSEHVVYIVPGGKCSGSDVVKSEKRHFAVLYRLEGAGVYCIDDQ